TVARGVEQGIGVILDRPGPAELHSLVGEEGEEAVEADANRVADAVRLETFVAAGDSTGGDRGIAVLSGDDLVLVTDVEGLEGGGDGDGGGEGEAGKGGGRIEAEAHQAKFDSGHVVDIGAAADPVPVVDADDAAVGGGADAEIEAVVSLVDGEVCDREIPS